MGVTRKILNWYARLAPGHGKSNPPYQHVVQIGDPKLRKVSEPVPLDKIKTNQIQTIIRKLEYVINKYGSLGMSAPQIGVNLRIFAMRYTVKQLASVPKELVRLRGMESIPFTVFINPKLKVIDYQKDVHSEGCESVQGYMADVARYREVQVTGLNAQGEPTLSVFKDWSARIAQHEMDHLDGRLFTDLMDRHTLTCLCWEEVNLSKGKIVLPFSPK